MTEFYFAKNKLHIRVDILSGGETCRQARASDVTDHADAWAALLDANAPRERVKAQKATRTTEAVEAVESRDQSEDWPIIAAWMEAAGV